MPVQHACTLHAPYVDSSSTRRDVALQGDARERQRAMHTYTLQAASLRTPHPHLRTARAQMLVGDRNLEGMLSSAVGDLETLIDVIGMDALVAMRQAEDARGPAWKRQARLVLVFDDASRADFIASLGHPNARYVIGSARDPQGDVLPDSRCVGPQAS
ncbi:hypothetical protein [Luteimonas terrae]|uniref:Uncharacterized protein n=1 Tax=Luteimonas terrae TaxID=1530191 RepID=A0A4R5UF15_9GAMM|nr:hypothetical protein [Luteimonas terrae]TDK33914.1 hypothetical protein E2F49_08010 [Luteimonas terrae]